MKKNKDKMEIAREVLALIEKYNAIDAFGGLTGQSYTCLKRIADDSTAKFDDSIRYDCFYNLNPEHRLLAAKIQELELASSAQDRAKLLKFWNWFKRRK
jgi:hypothetical protein